jgi:hypothetical protein
MKRKITTINMTSQRIANRYLVNSERTISNF